MAEITGFHPMEIKTNKFAIQRKLFTGKVEVVGEKHIKVLYKKPLRVATKIHAFVKRLGIPLITVRPFVNKKDCTKCGICAQVCPVKAIALKPYPVFDRKKCILCYCCSENCPYNAIKLKRYFFGSMINLKNF